MSRFLSEEEIQKKLDKARSLVIDMSTINSNYYEELLRDKNRLEFCLLSLDERYATQIGMWIRGIYIPKRLKNNSREQVDFVFEKFKSTAIFDKIQGESENE